MLGEYFVEQGFQVKCIDNGTDAPEAIIDTQPDVVLLDLMLPGQDDPKLQAMLGEYFVEQGFQVKCIDNGTDAPEAITIT